MLWSALVLGGEGGRRSLALRIAFVLASHCHEPDSAHIAYHAGRAFRHLGAAARVLASRLGFVSRIVHPHEPHHRIDAAFCALAAVGCCAAGVASDALAGLSWC
jgi:hypothetical protein